MSGASSIKNRTRFLYNLYLFGYVCMKSESENTTKKLIKHFF
ncbi:hypothetical protein AAJ76_2280003253 [Vairimorpha ceranae]|uniref:Uncharacterized protein n=1 Tax=Vairimorpha ceranae TaxID=40302 RepID=A0A0F9W7N0_9MICR|nr:hypothetical protein AAJ76_2280003253 [Vairimorpha ceranae]KKO73796.1 hypothetical protein AAJ76_2280003253 [Vairimorpha ceranae]